MTAPAQITPVQDWNKKFTRLDQQLPFSKETEQLLRENFKFIGIRQYEPVKGTNLPETSLIACATDGLQPPSMLIFPFLKKIVMSNDHLAVARAVSNTKAVLNDKSFQNKDWEIIQQKDIRPENNPTVLTVGEYRFLLMQECNDIAEESFPPVFNREDLRNRALRMILAYHAAGEQGKENKFHWLATLALLDREDFPPSVDWQASVRDARMFSPFDALYKLWNGKLHLEDIHLLTDEDLKAKGIDLAALGPEPLNLSENALETYASTNVAALQRSSNDTSNASASETPSPEPIQAKAGATATQLPDATSPAALDLKTATAAENANPYHRIPAFEKLPKALQNKIVTSCDAPTIRNQLVRNPTDRKQKQTFSFVEIRLKEKDEKGNQPMLVLSPTGRVLAYHPKCARLIRAYKKALKHENTSNSSFPSAKALSSCHSGNNDFYKNLSKSLFNDKKHPDAYNIAQQEQTVVRELIANNDTPPSIKHDTAGQPANITPDIKAETAVVPAVDTPPTGETLPPAQQETVSPSRLQAIKNAFKAQAAALLTPARFVYDTVKGYQATEKGHKGTYLVNRFCDAAEEIAKRAPSVGFGMLCGTFTRKIAQYAIASTLLTAGSGFLAAAAATTMAGAIGGGLTRLAISHLFRKDEVKQKGNLNLFLQGAVWGACGSALGAVLTEYWHSTHAASLPVAEPASGQPPAIVDTASATPQAPVLPVDHPSAPTEAASPSPVSVEAPTIPPTPATDYAHLHELAAASKDAKLHKLLSQLGEAGDQGHADQNVRILNHIADRATELGLKDVSKEAWIDSGHTTIDHNVTTPSGQLGAANALYHEVWDGKCGNAQALYDASNGAAGNYAEKLRNFINTHPGAIKCPLNLG